MASQERYSDSDSALRAFQKTTETLGLSYKFVKVSETTSTCFLKKHGKEIDRGNGKGVGIQSQLSAKYEALEHYLLTTYPQSQDDLIWSTYQDLKDSGVKIILSLPFLETIERTNCRYMIPWVSCTHINNEQKGYVPLISVNPLSRMEDSHLFARFASSNGCATGSNYEEAVIHGLSELIERDALSCFLYSSFIANKHTVKKIKKKSIPNYLYDYIHLAENKYHDNLVLLEITSDFGVPTFLASFTKQPCSIQPYGTGCSWNRTYALERTIHEAIQIKELSVVEDGINDEKILEMFKDWPAYYNCVKIPLHQLFDEIPETLFNETSQNDTPDSIYKNLLKCMDIKNIDVYNVKIYNDKHLNCIKLISPQLEQFHLCQQGHHTIPGERIRKLYCHDH